MNNGIELYKNRKIENIRTVQKTIEQLGSRSKNKNISGLQQINKYQENQMATGKLTRYYEKTKPIKNYHISGKAHTSTIYNKVKTDKTIVRSKEYPDSQPIKLVIQARSETEAKNKCEEQVKEQFNKNTHTNKKTFKQIMILKMNILVVMEMD